MSKRQVYGIVTGGLVAMVVFSALVGLLSPAPNVTFRDATAALLVAGSAAVAIERAIEAFWTVMGQLRSTYWPLNVPDEALAVLTHGLNDTLNPLVSQAQADLDQFRVAGNLTVQELATADDRLSSIRTRIAALQSGTLGTNQLAATAAVVNRELAVLQGQVPGITEVATRARDQVNALGDFASTFAQNPGRRLISLFAGAVLGLCFAGVTGLDIVHAAAGTTSAGWFHWGVVVSGIVLGLGSNPTHELIRSIQEYKQGQKAANAV